MSSDYLSHVPADAVPQAHPVLGRAAQPVLPPMLAKAVLMVAALVLFIPLWLDLLVQLGSAESWYFLRLLALGGIAGIVTLSVLILKLSNAMLKHPGRG